MGFGPLARHPDDLDLLLGVLAGPKDADRVAWQLQLAPARAARAADLRVAVWFDEPAGRVDRDTRRLLHDMADALRSAGANVDDDPQLPDLQHALDVAQRMIQGSISHALPIEEYERLKSDAARRDATDNSSAARWARNITQSARELNLALEARAHIAAAWADAFRVYDIVLCPVMPTPAFPHDQNPDVDARTVLVDGEPRSYGDQFAWLQAIGAAHLPVTVAPIGFSASGLPIGVQIVGALYEDRTTINCARLLGELIGGFQPPPGYA
jgi:amidase